MRTLKYGAREAARRSFTRYEWIYSRSGLGPATPRLFFCISRKLESVSRWPSRVPCSNAPSARSYLSWLPLGRYKSEGLAASLRRCRPSCAGRGPRRVGAGDSDQSCCRVRGAAPRDELWPPAESPQNIRRRSPGRAGLLIEVDLLAEHLLERLQALPHRVAYLTKPPLRITLDLPYSYQFRIKQRHQAFDKPLAQEGRSCSTLRRGGSGGGQSMR